MNDDAESLSDPRSSVREFLTARRARLRPEQVGLAPGERDGRVPNTARFTFLDPAAREFWGDHTTAERDVVGILRLQATRDPQDDGLQELVGELSTRSERFRRLWARHDVHEHTGGRKRLNHPVVGPLELDFDRLAVLRAPGLTLLVYTAPPGSASADALRLLASWASPAAALSASSSPTT